MSDELVKRWERALPLLTPSQRGIVQETIATIERQAAEIKRKDEALRKIAAWHFPPTGRYWDEPENKRPMSYSAAFGSNGERDYMRRIAQAALTPEAHK